MTEITYVRLIIETIVGVGTVMKWLQHCCSIENRCLNGETGGCLYGEAGGCLYGEAGGLYKLAGPVILVFGGYGGHSGYGGYGGYGGQPLWCQKVFFHEKLVGSAKNHYFCIHF